MSLWIKLKNSFWSHKKTLRLRAKLGNDAFWIMPKLWSYASENQQDGCFSGYSAAEIASVIGYQGEPEAMLEAMLEASFIDRKTMQLHDWEEHNGYHVEYAKRARNAAYKRWNQDSAGTLPPPPPISKEEIRREEKRQALHEALLQAYLKDHPGFSFPQDFLETWAEWVPFRMKLKKLKDPVTTFRKQLTKLMESPSEASAVLNQSMANGWQGLFPLKDGNGPHKNKEPETLLEKLVRQI